MSNSRRGTLTGFEVGFFCLHISPAAGRRSITVHGFFSVSPMVPAKVVQVARLRSASPLSSGIIAVAVTVIVVAVVVVIVKSGRTRNDL